MTSSAAVVTSTEWRLRSARTTDQGQQVHGSLALSRRRTVLQMSELGHDQHRRRVSVVAADSGVVVQVISLIWFALCQRICFLLRISP